MKICKIARYLTVSLFALAFGAGQGLADQQSLYSSGHWRVVKVTDASGAKCEAGAFNGDSSFVLVAQSSKANDVMLKATGVSSDMRSSRSNYENYTVQIDAGQRRAFRGARFAEGLWSYTLPHQPWSINFLAELSGGNSIAIIDSRGRLLFGVDIVGGDKAIARFIECSNSIWPS